MRILFIGLIISSSWGLVAQTCGGAAAFQILHFTKTNGFDHNTREQSAAMFEAIGRAENFTVTNSANAAIFNDLEELLNFQVIVFSNTSGNNLLNDSQQANLEAYMAAGGSFLGIHAATDTYRNRSWPFYNQLVGGIVQSNPNHTNRNYEGIMDVVGNHPSTANLPNPWEKVEEYYYWELNGGQLDPEIIPTLRVRDTGPESYDAARPISWYKEFTGGGRSYYTALGHDRNNYTEPDNDFRQLISDALCWCVESTITNTETPNQPATIRLLGNPVRDQLRIELPAGPPRTLELVDLSGRLLQQYALTPGRHQLNIAELPTGIYLLRQVGKGGVRFTKQ